MWGWPEKRRSCCSLASFLGELLDLKGPYQAIFDNSRSINNLLLPGLFQQKMYPPPPPTEDTLFLLPLFHLDFQNCLSGSPLRISRALWFFYSLLHILSTFLLIFKGSVHMFCFWKFILSLLFVIFFL